MKHVVAILALLASSTSFAAGLPGKYEMTVGNGLSGSKGIVVMLVNGNLETKTFEIDGDYMLQNFESRPFFNELNVELEWGSDEDHHYFRFTLGADKGQPVLTESCGVNVDGPNGYHDFDEASLTLRKWDKETREYVEVPLKQSATGLSKCQRELERKHLR